MSGPARRGRAALASPEASGREEPETHLGAHLGAHLPAGEPTAAPCPRGVGPPGPPGLLCTSPSPPARRAGAGLFLFTSSPPRGRGQHGAAPRSRPFAAGAVAVAVRERPDDGGTKRDFATDRPSGAARPARRSRPGAKSPGQRAASGPQGRPVSGRHRLGLQCPLICPAEKPLPHFHLGSGTERTVSRLYFFCRQRRRCPSQWDPPPPPPPLVPESLPVGQNGSK